MPPTEHENLTDLLTEQAALRPEAPAVIWSGGSWSFRELETLTWRLAARLREQGVETGDVVGVSFDKERHILPAILAVARIGATAFSIPQATPMPLMTTMMQDARVRWLLMAPDPLPPLTGPVARIEVDPDEMLRSTDPVDRSLRAEAPQAPWLLITGSGSTGTSKRIPLAHRQFLMRTASLFAAYDRGEGDRLASMAHLDFTASKTQSLPMLLTGGAIVLLDRPRTSVVAACRRHAVTVLFATVTHVEALLDVLAPEERHMLPTLRILYVSASTVSDALRTRIRRQLTPNLYVPYATNEVGLISMATPAQVATTPGTVGTPIADIEMELHDAEGRRCAPGQIGRLRVRRPGMFCGYDDDPEATRRSFENGWFIPGDLARLTDDGQLIHCGRADHMMIVNGINIYPAEIEAILTGHPAVRDAAAIPLRSRTGQELPVCAVALHPGSDASVDTLMRFVVERLGPRAPRRILILDRIPRTELGKLHRAELGRRIEQMLKRPEAP